MRWGKWGAGAALLQILFWCGCQAPPQEHIPRYPWTDVHSAVEQMAHRARATQTVNAACTIALTRPDGQSVQLDGALALSLADHAVRLRTWKFNQAVFDLTLTNAGLWLEVPSGQERRQQVLPAGLSAAQLARALSLFGAEFFEQSDLEMIDRGGGSFELSAPTADGKIVARVDRSTLTVRQYRLIDAAGRTRFTLDLSDYIEFPGTVFPTRMIATNAGSRIDIRLRDLRINSQLPPRAFVPPHGAEKMP